ncbi:MAG: proton-translocating transhydrogenase family protein [Thermoleophilia bacterium]
MPLLHTLMALTNALSAIALVGSLVVLGQAETTYSMILGFIAVVASTINVVGGSSSRRRCCAWQAEGVPPRVRGPGREEHIIQLIYLVEAGFALSLKWMSSAATARRGIMAA